MFPNNSATFLKVSLQQCFKMTKSEAYLSELNQLIESYGIDKVAALLGKSSRGVSNWISESPKIPHEKTKIQISELFRKHLNGSVRPQEAQHGHDSEYMRKYIEMLVKENSRLAGQEEASLKMLVELKDIVSENFALLSSLRYAVALILLNQRKGSIRDLSRKEVSDLVVIAGTLDKVVSDAMALSPKMDKIRESIR